jgi:multiphosphoryl transfer protein
MVSIVLISHSRALALALKELVQQVSGGDIAISVAAGVGPDREEFGTDAVEIMQAVQSVYSEDGVVVLMDLGSAIISAELALDLLPSEMRDNIILCSAPFIEGAVAAAVQAGLGSQKEVVCSEARLALGPKQEQLGEAPEAPAAAPEQISGQEYETVVLKLSNLHGLHARPAARFVKTASSFDAEVKVRNLTKGKGPVSARSLNALATLAALKDHEIEVSAVGAQAEEALKALSKLVADNFGEAPGLAEKPPTPAAEPLSGLPQIPVFDENILLAVPVSEGAAVARLYHLHEETIPIPGHKISDTQLEWESFQNAVRKTHMNISQRQKDIAATVGEDQAEIFQAHLFILEDPELHEKTKENIFQDKDNAAKSWKAAVDEAAAGYQALDDPYLQQRSQDVLDVGSQVLSLLLGKADAGKIKLDEPVILFADDLTPTQTAGLDFEKVLGIITVGGGPTSHSAILARGMAIPAVAGVSPELGKISEKTRVGLDGFDGKIWIDPSEQQAQDLNQKREAWLAQRSRLLQEKHQPALTRDGHAVEVSANVGSLADAAEAVANGAEGIGLLRTEFLFLTRKIPPDESEQLAALTEITEVMGQLPIIVRTLDVGGDKELPYIQLPAEANPFLGIRAIRLSLREPELFKTQLRAILRAGENARLRIMFPMVSSHHELLQARRYLEEVHQSLSAENLPHLWPIETGIMIEVPSAAVMSPILAPLVDFFSIGTNDLTQYTLAAERGNPALPDFADALHPAVLRLIQMVVQSAHAEKKWAGVCGELAGDPLAVPVLVGLGVDELSLNPKGIPQVKHIIRSINLEEARRLAENVLHTTDAAAARKLARSFYQDLPKG